MTDLHAIPFTTIDGEPASLADYAGHAVLVVNVASECGLTPQYEATVSTLKQVSLCMTIHSYGVLNVQDQIYTVSEVNILTTGT